MPRRSRRGKKSSRRNLYLSVGIIAILVVSIAGFYAYQGRSGTTTSVTTSSSSSSTGAAEYAVLSTTQGAIVIQLLPQAAPRTVANFVSLANSGFYNNLVWHRIVAGFVIQAGDPNTKNGAGNRSTWGQGGGPNTVPLETNSNYHNYAGYVGLARSSSPNSGSSQFYINLADNSQALDGQTGGQSGYTVFGQVVSGMNVVDAIAAASVYTSSSSPYLDQPTQPDQVMLLSVNIQNHP